MKARLSKNNIQKFRNAVYKEYRKNRRDFLWRPPALKLRRGKADPYCILVSEIMLQQTQVSRVTEKYPAFIKLFPTWQVLASASRSGVLKAWSGLGYNRRALYLKKIAEIVVQKFKGIMPHAPQKLIELPGIGSNTTGAISAFAFGKALPFIETNIRSVFIHHFFPKKKKISDKEILPLVAETLDTENPREWYYALMDYGAMLKATSPNPSRKSAHHQHQTAFEGSHRQLRGEILKILLMRNMSEQSLTKKLKKDTAKIRTALAELAREKFIKKRGHVWCICE